METLIQNKLFDLKRLNYAPTGDAVIYVTSKNFDGGAERISNSISSSVSFYELSVENWDDNLTPWEADPKMKGRIFGGNAKNLLDAITSEVIPVVKGTSAKVFIAGYSLAGLFSLWSMYESDVFSGCACCSGSLWYPGWTDFATINKVHSNTKIYLSIGDREKNSKNQYLKLVEEAYKIELKQLNQDLTVTTHFDLNPGGHFNDAEVRVIKGINWITSA